MLNFQTLVSFSLVLIVSIKANCQTLPSNLRVHTLGRDKGLSESTNDFVYKDHLGRVWLSSLEGLNRFDGRRVKVYKSDAKDSKTLYDSNVQSPFLADEVGDIWFTTVNSIHCYRHKRDNFDRYFINYKGSVFNNAEYTALFLEQNRWLWVQASDSLFRFDTKGTPQYQRENSQFLHKLQAARFAVDTFSNGKAKRIVACFWAYRKGIEILDYDEQTRLINRRFFFTGEVGQQLPPLTVKKAIIENDSLVWLSGYTGLVAFNPQKPLDFQIYDLKIRDLGIQSIVFWGNHQILISTSKSIFFIFDTESKLFSPLSIESKIGETATLIMPKGANNLYLDESNVLWFSAHQRGLFFSTLNQNNFKQIHAPNNLGFAVSQLLESKKGKYWLSSQNADMGVLQFSKEKNFILKSNLSSKSKMYEDADGRVWNITTNGKIQIFDNKLRAFITVKAFDTLQFFDACIFDYHALIICSDKGLYNFDLQTKQLNLIEGCNYLPFNIFQDSRQKIWIGSNDGQLYCYEKGNAHFSKPLKTIKVGGPINHFFTSTKDPSVLWVATAKGLIKINLNTLKDTLLTEKDGLPTNYFQAVLEDKQGNLWCSTNQGIFKYNPNTHASKSYTKRHGLSSDAYNRGAALLSSTGEMWFGGNNGVDVFHPDSIRDIGHAPQSAIVGLKIFDKYWKGETAIEVAERVTLQHNENTLTLELAAMEYTDPENNRFKVALVAKGDTIQWTDLGTQNYVTYPNLREGSYTFMLLTANSEGIWNQTPKTLVIEIKPPYWRTWWFLTLIALATIALVAYIVYLRLSKVIALQKIRLNLYENLHDDIGSRLTAIVLSVDMLMQKTAIKDEKLGQIGTISRNIVANMRRLVWATAPENDAVSTVAQQMQTDRRVLLPTGVQFILTMDKTLENLNIGGDKRYQMLSIFNESLTNIAKYAEATVVETRIEIREKDLIMAITDNGKGYDPNAKREDSTMSSGHGLRNMQRRANRIKGQLDITPTLGEGTQVKLSFPLNDETFWTKFTHLFSKYHQKW